MDLCEKPLKLHVVIIIGIGRQHNIALRIWEHVVGGMINFVFTDG